MNVILAILVFALAVTGRTLPQMGLPVSATLLGTPLLRFDDPDPSPPTVSNQLHELHQNMLRERRLSDGESSDHLDVSDALASLSDMHSVEPFLFESREEFFAKSVRPKRVIESFDPECERNQVWFPGNIYFGENKEFVPNFETFEIFESVSLIEFKMTEVNFLIKECINNMIENNLLIDLHIVKEACVGINFQILFQNYEDGMHKLRSILVELLHLKFARLGEDYRDDKEYFFQTLERFMGRDLFLPESMKVARKAAGYNGSRGNWDAMERMAQPEIEAFDYLHKKLRKDRKEIQEMLQLEAQKERDKAQKILWEEDMMDEFRRVRTHLGVESAPPEEESSSDSEEESRSESDSESSDSESSEESAESESSDESSESDSKDPHDQDAENEDKEEDEEKDNEDDGEGEGENKEKKDEQNDEEGGDTPAGEGRRKRRTRKLHKNRRVGVLGHQRASAKQSPGDKNKL
jgi:hypothetical protein